MSKHFANSAHRRAGQAASRSVAISHCLVRSREESNGEGGCHQRKKITVLGSFGAESRVRVAEFGRCDILQLFDGDDDSHGVELAPDGNDQRQDEVDDGDNNRADEPLAANEFVARRPARGRRIVRRSRSRRRGRTASAPGTNVK